MSARDLLYGSQFEVGSQPSSLAAFLRPSWRVPVTTLLVNACRGQRARREQLLVLNWAVRSSTTVDELVRYMRGEADPRDVGVRYEPALVRAINIAVGTGLLSVAENDWIELSAAGSELFDQICEQGLFAQEREALGRLPKPLPFGTAEQLLRGA